MLCRNLSSENGQVVIVLLLTMLVALAVGLTITQRSLTDISTSTQTEESSRAFSAAEAGIEKALNLGESISGDVAKFDLDNQSSAEVKVANNLPRQNQALEYPPIGKEGVAQFWLANPETTNIDPYYTQSQLDVYFGEQGTLGPDTPAIEVMVIGRDGAGKYIALRKLVDPEDGRVLTNSFENCTQENPPAINTTHSSSAAADRPFLCRVNIDLSSLAVPVMVRVRILYSNTNQRIAVKPYAAGGCIVPCSLPPQAIIYTSTGIAGQSQKTLQVFRTKIAPFFLDYAVFSNADIIK